MNIRTALLVGAFAFIAMVLAPTAIATLIQRLGSL